MNQQSFQNVWYSTEERVNSATKTVVFDDRGSLEVGQDKVTFKGKKFNIEAERKNISKISLTNQKINWVIYLIFNGFIIVYFSLIQQDIMLLIGLIVLVNGFGIFLGLSTKWICIEYKEPNGNPKKMFLADGSGNGWTGLFGGTKKLYTILSG